MANKILDYIRLPKRVINYARREGISALLAQVDRKITRTIKHKYLHSHPKVAFRLFEAYTRYHPAYTDSDLFKLLYVDPNNIELRSFVSRQFGRVRPGKWDMETQPFEEYGAYRGIKKYFEEDDDSVLKQHFRENIRSDSAYPWGHQSIDDFNERLGEIEDLYHSMEESGYVPQYELADINSNQISYVNNGPLPRFLDDITVDIGRDGRLLWSGYGAHRLSIAKLLNLDEVCVNVANRHSQWQHLRDKIRETSQDNRTIESFQDHPDLYDLYPAKRDSYVQSWTRLTQYMS